MTPIQQNMNHGDRPVLILVVEDNEDYRDTVNMMLSSSGFDVIEAADGLEGLAQAKMHLPDLILCDIVMPTMNGHEMLRATREIAELSKIPFIFLTGRNDKNDFRIGMELGADDYLTKPFTIDELLGAVRTRLQKRLLLQKYYASQNEDVRNSIGLFLPHEIHTPLNGILGLAELLKNTPDLSPEEIGEYAGLILESGQRLYRLLENFNLFSLTQFWMKDDEAIATMRAQSSPAVSDVFHAMMKARYGSHARKDAVLAHLPSSCAKISDEYLGKIFEELIDNAFKFSASGTPVHVTGEASGTEIVIRIRDEGRGMTKEQIAKVAAYTQFERRQYEQQGAGLGLAVSRALSELHGGSLEIDSEPGRGTAVTVRLPTIHT